MTSIALTNDKLYCFQAFEVIEEQRRSFMEAHSATSMTWPDLHRASCTTGGKQIQGRYIARKKLLESIPSTKTQMPPSTANLCYRAAGYLARPNTSTALRHRVQHTEADSFLFILRTYIHQGPLWTTNISSSYYCLSDFMQTTSASIAEHPTPTRPTPPAPHFTVRTGIAMLAAGCTNQHLYITLHTVHVGNVHAES